MNNFIVSARKYRPSTFSTVVGQEYIVTTLKNAIKNNQLAQAFLFTGPRGVGKTTCARILAKTINCTNLSEDFEACNQCESCKSFNELASFNVHELDAASNNSVDDIRVLVDQVRIPPQAGLYKVYIIDEVHMLSASAFNAFLKTLEEPPAYAKFILATTEKHKIIPTILSRCQVFDFKRIKVEDISKHLAFVAHKENVEFEPQALHIIATKSDGALRDALSIFDQMVSFGSSKITTKAVIENLNILDYEYYFRLVNAALDGDTSTILLILDEIFEKGFDGQAIVNGLSEHLRSLLVCKDPQTLPLLEVHESLATDYLNQSRRCAVRFLIRALDIISSSEISYKAAGNKRFYVELAILKIVDNEKKPEAENKETQLKTENTEKKNQPENLPKEVTTEIKKPERDQEVQANTQEKAKEYITGADQSSNAKPSSVHDIDDISVVDIIHQKSKEKPVNGKPEEPYTDENVMEAFKKITDELRSDDNENTYIVSLLNTTRFEKKEGNWILLVGSATESEAFRGIDLLSRFRKHLSNSSFQFQTMVEARAKNNNTLTKKEKIEDFIRHNPDIQRIMKEFDTEPDI